MSENSIVSESCCVEIGNSLVLDDVSFEVTRNSLIAVVGPNGGGKTTLFNAITGLVPITKGSLKINGENIKKGNGNIGYVPQSIGIKAIKVIIALTTCKPIDSTIFAKFIQSS